MNNENENFYAQMVQLGLFSESQSNSDTYRKIEGVIHRYDGIKLATTFAAITTFPELQSNAYRLEALVHFSLSLANGNKKPKQQIIQSAFTLLGEETLSLQEDPAEDVFLSLVHFQKNNYRIFEGLWEGSAFHLQRFIDILEGIPNNSWVLQIKRSIEALLKLSEAIANRKGLVRYSLGNQEPLDVIPKTILMNLNSLKNIIKFSNEELSSLGITLGDLQPFIFDLTNKNNLLEQEFGSTDLEKCPLLYDSQHITVLLPSAISVAIRRHVIDQVQIHSRLQIFESLIADSYKKLFDETTILGDLPFSKLEFSFDSHSQLNIANTLVQMDVGRALHIIFFVDDFSNKDNGWINSRTLYGQELGESITKYIARTKKFVKQDPNYKSGMTLIVGCGWGRMLGFDMPNGQDDDWKIESLSAYDLSIFSWSPEMTAMTFFKLLEARDTVTIHNAELMNFNGLLNLYGWAKELNYHLIPHEQLQEEYTGSKLLIIVNQNSLLNIRAEAYHAYDMHVKIGYVCIKGRQIICRLETMPKRRVAERFFSLSSKRIQAR